jgi:hypothetical protein
VNFTLYFLQGDKIVPGPGSFALFKKSLSAKTIDWQSKHSGTPG